MNWQKLCANLVLTIENKTANFKHNKWDIWLRQIVKIYQWIEKNEILSPLQILSIPQNTWP